MIKLGSDLWRSFAPTSSDYILSCRAGFPGLCPDCAWIFPIRGNPQLSSTICTSVTLKVTKKRFLIFRWNVSFVNLGLFFCHKQLRKDPGSVLFAPSFQTFIHIAEIPPELSLHITQPSPMESFILLVIIVDFCWRLCSLFMSPCTEDPSTPDVVWPVWNGKLSWSAVNTLSNVAQDTNLMLLSWSHTAGSNSTSWPAGPPGPFLTWSFAAVWPQHILIHRVILPQVQNQTFLLGEFLFLLSAHSFNLLRSLWLATQPSALSATPPIRCHLQSHWRNLKIL